MHSFNHYEFDSRVNHVSILRFDISLHNDYTSDYNKQRCVNCICIGTKEFQESLKCHQRYQKLSKVIKSHKKSSRVIKIFTAFQVFKVYRFQFGFYKKKTKFLCTEKWAKFLRVCRAKRLQRYIKF